ncbi:MAG: hypothetical protein AB7E80_03330 [Hyphomicrobiaceae bacterium]
MAYRAGTETLGGEMGLRAHHAAEFIGVLLVIASTATQMFYVEPLRRQIDWNNSAFTQQQIGQLLTREILDNRIVLLKTANAPAADIAAAQETRKKLIERYERADAHAADMVLDKEPLEGYLQVIVIVLFGLGTLLAGYGRLMELLANNRPVK